MSEEPADDTEPEPEPGATRPAETATDDDPTPTDAEAPATDLDGGGAPTGWRVLVPVAVLEGETVPESVAELLGTMPVTVLGYHVLPEQTPPGQARLQFEERAQVKLDDLAATFREAGGDCDTRLVFTQDEEQTVDRVAAETGCSAVLVPNPAGEVRRLLVPLGGGVNAARVVDFVAALVGDRAIEVTLLHVAGGEAGREAGRERLADAASGLRGAGIAVDEAVVVGDSAVEAIAAAAVDHDVVVMGESEPSLRSFVFGESADRVAEQSVGPVVVVRRGRGAGEG